MQKNVISLNKDSEMLSKLLDSIVENNNQDCCFFINKEIVDFLKKDSDLQSKISPLVISYTWVISRDLNIEVERNDSEWKMIYSIKADDFEYKIDVDSTTPKKIFYSCEK